MISGLKLDIVIPVYNEGENILKVLEALNHTVKTSCRILICYDHEEDNTLKALARCPRTSFEVVTVKNTGVGVHEAIATGFKVSMAPAVLVFPADDMFNASIVDKMVQLFEEGCEIVSASRFARGGCMKGCPWLKATLVRLAAFTLYHFAHLPTSDPTNGFRLFSKKVIREIKVESTKGFAFSIELLVKCHRLGWKIGEVPAQWIERPDRRSRFRIFKWLPIYLRWYGYAFATAYGV